MNIHGKLTKPQWKKLVAELGSDLAAYRYLPPGWWLKDTADSTKRCCPIEVPEEIESPEQRQAPSALKPTPLGIFQVTGEWPEVKRTWYILKLLNKMEGKVTLPQLIEIGVLMYNLIEETPEFLEANRLRISEAAGTNLGYYIITRLMGTAKYATITPVEIAEFQLSRGWLVEGVVIHGNREAALEELRYFCETHQVVNYGDWLEGNR